MPERETEPFPFFGFVFFIAQFWLFVKTKKGPLQNDPKKRARFGARKGFQTSLVAIFLVCEDTE